MIYFITAYIRHRA